MPLYHFHLDAGTGLAGDVTGRALPDDVFALEEAKRAAIDALAEALAIGHVDPAIRVVLERGGGVPVAVIRAQAQVERPA